LNENKSNPKKLAIRRMAVILTKFFNVFCTLSDFMTGDVAQLAVFDFDSNTKILGPERIGFPTFQLGLFGIIMNQVMGIYYSDVESADL
jgi:hypothetical protein